MKYDEPSDWQHDWRELTVGRHPEPRTGPPVELLTTRTSDGVLLHGALAPSPGAAEGLLAVHGAWGNFYSSPVASLLHAGPARGLTVLSMNSRCHDLGSLGDGEPCIGLSRERFEDAPKDVEAAAQVLADRVERFAVVAHSYGAHRAAYWAAGAGDRVAALVLLSPGPNLRTTSNWFVDGAVGHHIARAAAAVAAGDPERLIVLGHHAPIPMVAEAATVLSVWGPDSLADSRRHVAELDIPVLVAVGAREPAPYRQMAEQTARAASRGELIRLDDDHYYARQRARMCDAVLDWLAGHGLGRPAA